MGKFQFSWDKVKDEIKQEESQKKKGFEKDQRIFKLTLDDKGNSAAIIRFLPDTNGLPWVKVLTHNFSYMVDGVKKYWIRNCINTFGYDKDCPICKKNMEYWKSAFESDKTIAGQRKRKTVFYSNILIIKNPANPETEGKVMILQYGQKIYDKIKEKFDPSEEIKSLGEYDEYMPCDLYEGANFSYIQKKVGEFPSFDDSKFGKQGKVGDEKRIEELMGQVYDLSEFIAEDKFPNNTEVIEKLGNILGISKPKKEVTQEDDDLEEFGTTSLVEDDIPDFKPITNTDSDDPDEEFFKNL